MAIPKNISLMVFGVLALLVGAILILVQPMLGIYITMLLSPLQMVKFVGGTFSFTRFVGIWTAVAVLGHALARRRRLLATGVEGPVIFMALAMAVSFLRAPHAQAVAGELLQFGSLYIWTLLIVNMLRDQVQFEKLAVVFLASGVYPILMALVEWFQESKGKLVIVTRIKSTFLLPTGLASFLVFFTLFALALLFYPGFSRFFRFIILGLFGAGLIVLILTLSRGPIFGVILGFGIILFALRRQIQTFGNLFAALLILALVVGAFYVLWPVIQWRLVTPLVEQFTTGASSDLNVGRRLREIELIRQFFLDYGPLGTGIGNYAQAIYKYQVLFNDPEIPTVPHNIILYFLGEVGIFGLLGFLWLVAWLIRHARFSYPRLKLAEGSIVYYIYVASLATLAGYIPLMLTHAGLFTNEIWLGLAFFLASARVGVEMAENAYRIPEPATSEQGRQAGVEHAY